VQEALAAAVEQDRAGGAAIAQIVAGAFSARRVVITGCLRGFHMVVVAIRLARRRRRRRRLLVPRVVARPPTHTSVKTAEVPREHLADRAQVDQQQRNPRQCVDYRNQPAPDRARCHATVSYGKMRGTLFMRE